MNPGSTALTASLALSLLLLPTIASYKPEAIPLVLPTDSQHRLKAQNEGLEFLRSLSGPVAPVVVIGPYRSGKSFTLNQLLNVSCDVGFGVGHTRNTQTKGIWIWGEPQPYVLDDGTEATVVYVDTEGFESTGKSTSYDDRIFAISTLISALLIYNLPEAIRESDIAKLSFAAELAQGFFERDADSADSSAAEGSFEPGAMLWLIQRDFLQGDAAAEVVKTALSTVPNPSNDPEVESLNKIRLSLGHIAKSSTGYSLVQPHLDRTHLCEMPDSALDPKYVEQRDGLRRLVKHMALPKLLNGKPCNGLDMASLISRVVEALNSQEIPNIQNLIETFNHELVSRCVKKYILGLDSMGPLPVDGIDMKEVDEKARKEASDTLKTSLLGHRHGVDLKMELMKELDRELQIKETENIVASSRVCSQLETDCEKAVDRLQSMQLPSMHKFESSFKHCRSMFEQSCVGPSRPEYETRLDSLWTRSSALFSKEYNDRLLTGLVGFTGVALVVFRYIFKVRLAEVASWLLTLVLILYPQIYTAQSMYKTPWWHVVVSAWELVMRALFGYDFAWLAWFMFVLALAVVMRVRHKHAASSRSKSQAKQTVRVSSGGARNLKDLDV